MTEPSQGDARSDDGDKELLWEDGERRFSRVWRVTDANRVASIGQLAASIAHEINGPLAGIATNASTCLRVLAGETLNLETLGTAVRRTLRDVNRASDIGTRLRALLPTRRWPAQRSI